MHKPFDTATKHLLETDPLAWLRFVGPPGTSASLRDTNLTTLTADADRVLFVEYAGEDPYLADIEFQASDEEDGDERVFLYAALLFRRYKLAVQSVVVLLRPEAEGPGFTGKTGFVAPGGGSLSFTYRIVKVWEVPAEELLKGSLATLPLAPIARVAPDELPRVIERMERRIDSEAAEEKRAPLWTATFLLMGLRYEREFIVELLKGVREMKESVTYQAILEEGEARGEAKWRTEEARRILIRQGGKRFGQPDEQTQAAIEGINSLEELERLSVRLLEVENWQELLN